MASASASVHRESLAGRPLTEVLEAVAERTPAPGGGSTAAWVSALAAGLVEMAAKFGRPADAAPDAWGRMGEVQARAQALRRELLGLADRELHAYAPVLEALALPREDPEREERIREASWTAAESPLEIARAAVEVAELAAETAQSGSRHLVGDAMAGALIAGAGCRAAARLAEINLADAPPDDPRLTEAHELARRAKQVA